MFSPAARTTDFHSCPMVTPGVPPIPHVGGPVLPPGAPTALIAGLPAARMGDMAVCVGPPDVIIKGSPTVLIAGKPAARVGESTAHGGLITVGYQTVLIGNSGPATAVGITPFLRQIQVEAQIQALRDSSRSGSAFCLECELAARAQQNTLPSSREPFQGPVEMSKQIAALKASASSGSAFCEPCAAARNTNGGSSL